MELQANYAQKMDSALAKVFVTCRKANANVRLDSMEKHAKVVRLKLFSFTLNQLIFILFQSIVLPRRWSLFWKRKL